MPAEKVNCPRCPGGEGVFKEKMAKLNWYQCQDCQVHFTNGDGVYDYWIDSEGFGGFLPITKNVRVVSDAE